MTPGRRSVAMAAIELYKRSKENVIPRQRISCPNDVYHLMFNLIAELEYEEFWALYLTQAGTVIKRMRIGAGGIDGTYADVRLILRYAIECNATQLCICHNHPSGNTRPSSQDKNLTHDPLGDLEILMGRAPGMDGKQKVRTSERKFAVLVRFPTPGCQYYPVPYYTAIFRGDWFDIKRMSREISEYFLNGCTGLYFMIDVSEPIDLQYNADEWE